MDTHLTTAARGLLAALAHGRPVRVTARPWATVWDLEGGGSTFRDVATRLEAAGLVDILQREHDPERWEFHLQVTDMGRAALQKTTESTTQAPAQHLPRRGDAVERWMVATLDKYPGTTAGDLLTLYRNRADAGVALDADLEG